jgi:flavodoxin
LGVFGLNRALIIYYSEHHSIDKSKLSNEEKVVNELNKLFVEKKISTQTLLLEPSKRLHLKDQFKKEKEIKLLNKIPDLSNYSIIVIGTPVVGAMTSSPVINSFIRQMNFSKESKKKPIFVIYSTGIISGFELKKMTSLLSMKGIKPVISESFKSMFDFDSRKINEVKTFFNKFIELA